MWSIELFVIVAVTFVLAGFTKGLVGLGLPTVSLALLTATLGLKEAMALMLVPSFVTNIWQGLSGAYLGLIFRRLWTLFLAVCIVIWFGANLLTRLDTVWLSMLLGLILCGYSAVSLTSPQMPSPGRAEYWLSPLIGAANGLLTGLTGSFAVPGVFYLQALGLPRDALIQAMGILFLVSTMALAFALQGHNLLPRELGILSAVALIPALGGMIGGRRVRRQLTERQFRQLFFSALLILGLYIIVRSIL